LGAKTAKTGSLLVITKLASTSLEHQRHYDDDDDDDNVSAGG